MAGLSLNTLANITPQTSGLNAAHSASFGQKIHSAHPLGQALNMVGNNAATAIGDISKISTTAAFFGKLRSLQTENPAQFKDVVTGIVEKLKASAQAWGASSAAGHLAALADQFASLAGDGNFSPLAPSKHSISASGIKAYAQNARPAGQSMTTMADGPAPSGTPEQSIHAVLQGIFSAI